MARKKPTPNPNPQASRHQPTDEQRRTVWLLSGYGNPAEEIAAVLGVSETTLHEHYGPELEDGRAEPDREVLRNLHRLALTNDFHALRAIELWLRFVAKLPEYAPQTEQLAAHKADMVEKKQADRQGKKAKAQEAAEQPPEEDTGWSSLLH